MKVASFLVILALGAGAVTFLVLAKPQPIHKEKAQQARVVRSVVAEALSLDLTVKTQGVVRSKQMISLVPQVAGQIIEVSDNFVAGGHFKKGDVILRIDPRDYDVAVISAQSKVVEAQQRLDLEKAESDLARTEWQMLGKGDASPLTLRMPQLADARAKVKAAKAALDMAGINLERSVIRAPFTGMLSEKMVDLGQYLTPGGTIGKYYSTEILEIRLPLSGHDYAQINPKALDAGTLPVTLYGDFGTGKNVWQGRIVRSEGLIDVKSRILYIVGELKGEEILSRDQKNRLNIGQFVSAEVKGRSLTNVFKLPREVLRQGNQLLVIDSQMKLRTRMITVIESNDKFIVVSDGIKQGDIICTSLLGIAVEGLLVSLDESATS